MTTLGMLSLAAALALAATAGGVTGTAQVSNASSPTAQDDGPLICLKLSMPPKPC